jgi:tol-pal system protein YbgF
MYFIHKRGIVPGCLLGLGMAAVLLTLPAAALSQTKQNLEQRVAKMERMLDSGTLLKLLQSVEELKAEVRELRGQLEQQQFSLSKMTDRQRELYLDVDRRLQRVETAGVAAGATAAAAASAPGAAPPTVGAAAAGSTTGGSTGASTSTTGAAAVGVATAGTSTQASTSQTSPAAVDPVKEQQAYQTAFNLLKAGRYDQAAKSFQTFLADYPASKFADNAQYWLGESYYVTRNFDNAMREFEKLVAEHPDSQKLSHALLKVGYIHDELGQKEKAREVLTELTESYPNSTAAGLATKRLERMRSQ